MTLRLQVQVLPCVLSALSTCELKTPNLGTVFGNRSTELRGCSSINTVTEPFTLSTHQVQITTCISTAHWTLTVVCMGVLGGFIQISMDKEPEESDLSWESLYGTD